jgi:D-glycero-D-manno-heptose 1,7-bisphosphate phosphatase
VTASKATPDGGRRAAFFDRDGVLNVDREYVSRIEDFAWMPGAVRAVRLCNEAGALVFVVSNQSGIARGFYDEAAVESLHTHMAKELAAQGARIDAFRFCPHHPEGEIARYRSDCRCRKPAPGMVLDLLAEHGVDPAASFLVGDKATDIAAARAAGVKAFLYRAGPVDALVERILSGAETPAEAP